MCLYRDTPSRNGHAFGVLTEFFTNEVLACVMRDLIRWPNVGVDPAYPQKVPCMFGSDILHEPCSLVTCSFVDYMQNWLASNVHDVDVYRVVEMDIIVSKCEFEASR